MDKRTGTGITSAFTILSLGMLNGLFLWLIFPRKGEINLAKFMNPSYKWIVYIAFGLLVFFMVFEIRNLLSRRDLPSSGVRSRNLTVLSLSVPLLFFLAAKDTYLTTEMKNIAVIGTDPTGRENGLRESISGPLVPETPGGETEINILNIFENREEYLGKKVQVVGIAQNFPELGSDKLYLYRLLITCCAADAQPLGLIVQIDSPESIESNRWYLAEGVVSMVKVEELGDKPFLGLIADNLRAAEEPDIPFLF